MEFEVKYYRYHDPDIIALREAGYPVGKMIKQCLIAYANENPIKFHIDKKATKISSTKAHRCRIRIDDEKTIALLKNIKPRFRNNFCKMLFRESIAEHNLAIYFQTPQYNAFEEQRTKGNVLTTDVDINYKKVKEEIKRTTVKKIQELSGVTYNKVPEKKESVVGPQQIPQPTFVAGTEKGDEYNQFSESAKLERQALDYDSNQTIFPQKSDESQQTYSAQTEGEKNDPLISLFDNLMD